MGSVSSVGHNLYHEEVGKGVPILLIHPSGATASTWGSAVDELARVGRVITYDRRGYARTGGEPVRKVSTHTADAAALLERGGTAPAVVVGISSAAMIAIDLALRRPDLVQTVIEHEGPWRFTRQVPTRFAGRHVRDDGIVHPARPTGRRRRSVVAVRLQLP